MPDIGVMPRSFEIGEQLTTIGGCGWSRCCNQESQERIFEWARRNPKTVSLKKRT